MVKRVSNTDQNLKQLSNAVLVTPRLSTVINDSNGAALLGQTAVASAVNYLIIQNADAGNDVWLYPAGTDSNIDLVLGGKGTGTVKLSSGDNVASATNAMGTIVHGSTGSTSRPSGYSRITWIGTATPSNATTNDIWVDTN